jgi:hypothetical protein
MVCADVMADGDLSALVPPPHRRRGGDGAAPLGIDLAGYAAALAARFGNPAIAASA